MNAPALLAVAALCGVTARRLCDFVCSRLRSRRWIEYLRYSINEGNAHAIPGPTATAPQTPTGPRPRPARSLIDTIGTGDRSIRISGLPPFSERRAAFTVHDHAESRGTALGGPTWW